MGDSCSVDGGCSSCSFGQRLTALNEADGEEWPVVMVKFRESSRTRFFAPGAVQVRPNDWVVVDTSKGEEAGRVIAANQRVRAAVFAGPLKPLRRLAEPEEVTLVERLEREAKGAMRTFREQIKHHKLTMKPIRAEYSFDGKRLTFYYSSEGRIDFRGLVRDLAQHFGLRIDLRQVGARDEARLLGGVGKCGRSLCCSSWLQTYPSVTVKQAKEQDLPLNPTKISGVCGRLLCCLSYENDQYVAMKRALPRLGQFVPTPQGTGKVIGLHTLKGAVVVYIEGMGVAEFPASELRSPDAAPAEETAVTTPDPAQPREGRIQPRQPRVDRRGEAGGAPGVDPPFAGIVAGEESPVAEGVAAVGLGAAAAAAEGDAPRPKRSRRHGRRGPRNEETAGDGG